MATYGHQGGGWMNADQRASVEAQEPEYKTARGISRKDLNRLDAAHKVLMEFEDDICDAMREIGLRSASNSPRHIAEDVEAALAMLVSEPVQ